VLDHFAVLDPDEMALCPGGALSGAFMPQRSHPAAPRNWQLWTGTRENWRTGKS
jgi:hypothetical protein